MRVREITITHGSVFPTADRVRYSRLIVFVHGTNTPPARAKQVYQSFRARLKASGVTFQLDSFVELYWPSYVKALVSGERTSADGSLRDFARGMKFLSALSYPVQLRKAQNAGRALGEYIAQLQGPGNRPTDIVLVAHSLGCRVVLEAMLTIATKSANRDNRVSSICLLGGAVPTFMLRPNGRLVGSAKMAQKSYVLFSPKDAVLQVAFRIGQTAAGEGNFPTAIGTSGEPAAAWTKPVPTGLQHGDYIENRAGSEWVAPYVARLLGVTAPLPKQERSLGTWPDRERLDLPTMPIREWHIKAD
jgi:pimeloyl-ACP methyl ester carboxylesterase